MFKFYKIKILTFLLTCSFMVALSPCNASYDANLLKDSNFFKHDNNKNTDYGTTKINFQQSQILENCSLIAAIATLPSKPDLYNKVVPQGQNSTLGQYSVQQKYSCDIYKGKKFNRVAVRMIDLPTTLSTRAKVTLRAIVTPCKSVTSCKSAPPCNSDALQKCHLVKN